MPLSLAELEAYAAQAGFSGDSAKTIAAIAMAESGGNPNAINYNDPGGSYGLTQINAAAHGPGALAALGDPLNAFQQAFRISGGGANFTPWSTFNSGAYLPFLNGGSSGGAGGVLGAGGGAGGGSGGLTGTTATGQPTTSQSPLSAIFSAIGNLFQSAGLLLLGGILVAIGAWYIAKPKG